jgi:hypothetical protein
LGSVGENSFIRTDIDIAFLPGIVEIFRSFSVPSSPIFAENNYWDANNPVAADPLEAFVVDLVRGRNFRHRAIPGSGTRRLRNRRVTANSQNPKQLDERASNVAAVRSQIA